MTSPGPPSITSIRVFAETLEFETDWKIGIGGGVWSSAEQLVSHFESAREVYRHRLRGRRVLELGAGTGLAGLGAALVAPLSELVLTDIGDHVALLRRNLERNRERLLEAGGGVALRVAEFDWTSEDVTHLEGPFDVVIGTDVAYHESLYEDVANAIDRTTKADGVVILGVTRSDTGPSFFQELCKRGFTYHRIRDQDMGGKHTNSNFGVFIVWREEEFLKGGLD